MPEVSVILPIFNAHATLEQALRSIQAQTHTGWELLAFDDGSTDASRGMVGAMAGRDSRIRVLDAGPRAHVGIVEALRRACAEARGDFLFRMDADDIAYPARIEAQLALLRSDERIGLCGAQVCIPNAQRGSGRARYRDWLNALVHHEDLSRERFIECPVAHPAFAMRREAFEEVGGYQDHGGPEDYDLVLRFFEQGWRVENCESVLLEWRDSPGRLSMRDPRYSEAAFRALKRRHLFRGVLAEGRRFHQWGAGEVGKRWLREWEGQMPEAVVDIHPRKIGRRIHHVPVIPPEVLPPPGETVVLVAVGTPGARDEIRDWFTPRGYREAVDYWFLA